MHLKGLSVYRKLIAYVLVLGVLMVCGFFVALKPAHAVTGINQQLNFQGRLLNAQGAVVADGYYNIEFKIYQDGDGQTAGNTTGTPAGSLKWTEDYVNNNNYEGVMVKNGYMSVQLGSKTPFGSNVDWNQDTLWLSMNIAGSDNTCATFNTGACLADGEMLPMKRLSSTVYSMNSGLLNGLTSAQFLQIAQGVQTDASTNTNSIYVNKTGTGNLMTLQSSGTDAFTLNNSGDILFGNNADHTISVTTANADAVGNSLSMTAGNAGTGASALAGGNLVLQGGAGGGTNGVGGDVNINAGAHNGTGTDGTINIGNSYASTIQIGSTTLATGTQTINIGNNNTAGGTTNVTLGSGSSATAGTTTIQSKGDMTMTSSNGNMSISTTAGTLGISGSGNTSVLSTGGTLQVTGYGDTSLSSTNGNTSVSSATGTMSISSSGNSTISSSAGTVGITSSGNTTIGTNSATRVTVDTSNAIYFGNGVTGAVNPFTVSATGGTAGVAGSALTVKGGTGGSSSTGGALNLQGGAGGSTTGAGGAVAIQGGNATAGNSAGGDLSLNAGIKFGSGADGNIYLGNSNTNTIQIGNTALAAGTQTINIGTNNTTGGTTNITIGSGSSATAGTTALQAKGSITISTNGVARGTFDNAGNLYLGNGVTAAAPSNFSINGTGSTTTAVAGGTVNIQGGTATVGNAAGGVINIAGGTGIGSGNGGNLNLSGGTAGTTGTNGLVVITTPTFSTTANDANCYTGGSLVAVSCTIASSSINNSSAVLVGFNTASQTAILPDPNISTAGRVIYVTAANGSNDFTLSVNGGGTGNTIAMRQNTTATMIWNGNDWTAAGASSSTTLQSAYDNTLQSAGGAELIVSHTGTTNGLTIRDSSTNPVDGTLLSVQTSSAAGLLSVNSNVTEYSSDSGAEVAGGTSSTFPASTWAAVTGSTVSRYTTVGDYIATGQASVSVATSTSANSGVKNTLTSALTANTNYNVSFTSRLSSGTFTDMNVYYSIDGSAASIECTVGKAVNISIWTKVNCTFAAPASGITTGNAILIRQTGSGTARTFYVDNLSVTIAADYNYATDGSVNDDTNFATNWSSVSSATVTRSTSVGYDASDSVQVDTTGTGQGTRNKLSVNPLPSTLYRVTVYASSSSALSTFTIRYSRDGGTNFVSCVDYNTQTITTPVTDFTKVTCYVTTDATAPSNPYVYFTQSDTTARTFHVDAFSMALSSNSVPNVQIGSGINGGPVTLLTLDRGASAPIASDNDALLGSMYYDTSLGKLQCYEADGWGACGSSPDNVVTISPEFTNAVMHGTGVGTMTSDLCSSTLGINDGSSSQPTICGSNETYNFYKWTSPQASAQTYGIYVTYQLPSTFKEFASGETSLMGRTDSSNATVQYQIYRNDTATGLTACGSAITVSTGSQSSWQIQAATGAADPSTCNFAAGNSIVFKISMTASQNANSYVGNLNFIFSNR